MYDRFGKRLLDVVLSGAAMVVLCPLLAITGLAIRIEDGSPVLYRQARTGRLGGTFTLLKFRSMPVGSASVPSAGMRAARVTRVGRAIRRLNIDELPQLFNILGGDMSVVGPRPPLDSQATLIELRSRSSAWSLRPGLTGLAQVCAFDGMTEAEKAQYDDEYAQRVTLARDLHIIGRTVLYLFKRPPVY